MKMREEEDYRKCVITQRKFEAKGRITHNHNLKIETGIDMEIMKQDWQRFEKMHLR